MRVSIFCFLAIFMVAVISQTGCTSNVKYDAHQQQLLTERAELLDSTKQFVRANMYTAMIHVWSTDRRSWNLLLNAHACGAENEASLLNESYQVNQPVFSEAMKIIASQQTLFDQPEEQAVLADVSQLAYRLFSISYAQGYARQIKLADEISSGIREELCGGRIIDANSNDLQNDVQNDGQASLIALSNTFSGQAPFYTQQVDWLSFNNPLMSKNNGLQAHAQRGYQAFQALLQNQQEHFDALVYSHAYEQLDDYEMLFFEVNKFENVEWYGAMLGPSAELQTSPMGSSTHNDFGYLVLSSGYHWGMMSVLAMLEEEYPRLHDMKRAHAVSQVKNITRQLEEIGRSG